MYVRKLDGSLQQFDRDRIFRTCLRNGASNETAVRVAGSIEKELYDGMSTKDLLRSVWSYLGKHPESHSRIDLRLALSLLKPRPDFENYASLLLRSLGYSVEPNKVLRGRCVEHEVDAIARKEDRTVLVEVKHHDRMHTYTPLDVVMKVWATLQDLTEGRKLGYNDLNFTSSMILCNTKFTNHARAYADCAGVGYIGWKSPAPNGLETIIERNALYPVTLLRDVDRRLQRVLVGSGILTLRQLFEEDAAGLVEKRRISNRQLSSLREKSRKILAHGGSLSI